MKKLNIKYHFDKYLLRVLIKFTFNKTKLKQIQSELNSWKYPTVFSLLKPKYYDKLPNVIILEDKTRKLKGCICKYDFIHPSSKLLKKVITHKEFLEYNWYFKLKNTHDFESWYNNSFPDGCKNY